MSSFIMKKISIILSIVFFVFGYAVFDAVRVDRMLSVSPSVTKTGSVITSLPMAEFSVFGSQISPKSNIRKVVGKDKRILVHFWATWCAPCEKEFPDLVEAINMLLTDDSLVFVLVAVADQEKEIRKFLKKYKVKSKNIILLEDKSESHKIFGTYKLPESYLFDSNNRLVKKLPGKQAWTQSHIINLLKH